MKKGFTFIELLVVIAIIGILSSIVISSLSTAREKASARDNMTDKEYCQGLGDTSVSRLPVKCFKYFNIPDGIVISK